MLIIAEANLLDLVLVTENTAHCFWPGAQKLKKKKTKITVKCLNFQMGMSVRSSQTTFSCAMHPEIWYLCIGRESLSC